MPFARTQDDRYRNRWDQNTDFGLDRFRQRPLFFYHAGRAANQRAGTLLDDSFQVTSDGLYVEADVDDNDAGNLCLALVDRNAAGWSSGTMPNYIRAAADGYISQWWIVEGSIAHIHDTAAQHGLTRARFVRSIIGDVDDDEQFLQRSPVMAIPVPHLRTQSEAPPAPPAPAAPSSDVWARLESTLDALNNRLQRIEQTAAATTPPTRALPASGAHHPASPPAVSVTGRWDNYRLSSMLMIHQLSGLYGGVRRDLFDNEFLRAVLSKASHLQDNWHKPSAHAANLLDEHTYTPNSIPSTRIFDDEAQAVWRQRVPNLRADEAMQTDLTGFGQELLDTLLHSTVWYQIELESRVMGLIPSMMMPSDPFEWPTVGDGPTVRRVRQIADRVQFSVPNSPIPDSKIETDKIIFISGGLGAMTLASEELFEDSRIPLMDIWTRQYLLRMRQAIDYVLLNGDERETTDNISHFGANPVTDQGGIYDRVTAWDGLRRIAVAGSRTVATPTVTDTLTSTLGKLMGPRGRLGLMVSNQALIVDPGVAWVINDLAKYETLDQVGPMATLLTGEVGRLRGRPIVVSDELEYTNANGQIPAAHNGTKGQSLLIYRPGLMIGIRRQIKTRMAEVPGTEGRVIWTTARMELQEMEAGSVAYGYNATV